MIPLHFQLVKPHLEESCPGVGAHFKKNSDVMVEVQELSLRGNRRNWVA